MKHNKQYKNRIMCYTKVKKCGRIWVKEKRNECGLESLKKDKYSWAPKDEGYDVDFLSS